jgi:hypothetical protein
MVSMAVPQWPPLFIREQIAAGFDAIVYLKRAGHRRQLSEISALKFHEGQISLELLC